MEEVLAGLLLALGGVALCGLYLFWRQRQATTSSSSPESGPVTQLREEIEVGQRWLRELSRGRQVLETALQRTTNEPEFISAAAEILALRLSIALEASQIDGLILRVGERLQEVEREMMARRSSLPPPSVPSPERPHEE